MSTSTRNYLIAQQVTLVTEECYLCGVTFAMPDSMQDNRRRDRKDFYCPNGHGQHYLGKTAEQKLREQLEEEQRRLVRERASRDRAEADANHQRRKAAAARGQVTKIKRRVGKGVCPCCTRSFANLAAHMAGQHPDFAAPEVTQ